MPLRVNPIILLGLITAFILTVAVFASAMGGSPGDAVSAAMGQIGKPYVFGTDGPATFSCAGLMRYALRTAGVDPNAPWTHGGYLSAYPNDATPQYGDIVVYDSGVAMYIGNDTVVMANDADGKVGTYPLNSIGTILGYANPYGGAAAPAASPAATGSTLPAGTSGDLGTGLGTTTGDLGTGLGGAVQGVDNGLGYAPASYDPYTAGPGTTY